ncbi:MAG: NADH-quinone oxidoreductase subunit J, partial [Burkholderiaceae bacterium]
MFDITLTLFYAFAAITVFAAIRVITARNPVHAALYRIPDKKSGKKPPQPKRAKVAISVADRGELAPARR